MPTWNEGEVFRTLTNPVTCGIGRYPAVVSDEEWLRAMTRLIKKKADRLHVVQGGNDPSVASVAPAPRLPRRSVRRPTPRRRPLQPGVNRFVPSL